jgi:hypothetical protein
MANVTRPQTTEWAQLAAKPPAEALATIYAEAISFSFTQRDWYWRHIGSKRAWGSGARAVTYLFAVFGVIAPLVTALVAKDSQLAITQIAVAALAAAGLVQGADKFFGWSSGWLRYVTTVTAMEKLTLQFELDWVGMMLVQAPSACDVRGFFDIAKAFRIEIEKRRSEETDGWVAEFNSGMAALNEMIKFQKDATEKAAQAADAARDTATGAQQLGALELTLTRGDAIADPIAVSIDGHEIATISGASWATKDLAPGLHVIAVGAGVAPARKEFSRAIEIKPGALATLTFALV